MTAPSIPHPAQDTAAPPPRNAVYIAGPWRDWVFLIATPLLALLAFVPFGTIRALSHDPEGFRFGASPTHGFITAVIFSHLILVFFRSHGNAKIFALYPRRFIGIPILLFVAMVSSTWILVTVSVLAVWWDVYHSAMQTFGIGRIYDMKSGNAATRGRRMDIGLNLLLYVGPILAGASLMLHMESFFELKKIGNAFFGNVPAYAENYTSLLTWCVVAVGVPFIAYYLWYYHRLHRQGYHVSFQKVWLYSILAGVSIFCWGFNSFGEAFFVMNFFHAVQYWFLVWHTEGKNLTQRFGLSALSFGRPLALAIYTFIAMSFGVWATGVWGTFESVPRGPVLYTSILMLCSILHFWYDGFIWSVRKGQVR